MQGEMFADSNQRSKIDEPTRSRAFEYDEKRQVIQETIDSAAVA
jgi:hypothetical protein